MPTGATTATAAAIATLISAPLLLAGAPAQGAASGSIGAKTETKVGCTSPAPYAEFEQVYASDGRVAAYKVLAQSDACMILENPTQVRLEESVDAFDFGWGTGQIWRVAPLAGNSDAPDTLFIRVREADWDGGT